MSCSLGEHDEMKAVDNSLSKLLVHWQDGRVAYKGEGQDGNSIDSLGKKNDTQTLHKILVVLVQISILQMFGRQRASPVS